MESTKSDPFITKKPKRPHTIPKLKTKYDLKNSPIKKMYKKTIKPFFFENILFANISNNNQSLSPCCYLDFKSNNNINNSNSPHTHNNKKYSSALIDELISSASSSPSAKTN